MVCHPFLQWTTFCQTSPPWPAHLGWPHRAWLSFIELDQAVVRVIRLTSFLWLWCQCVCPLMASCNTYHLTWVSLTLDMGYLFTAAPAKRRCCSLPWMRGIKETLINTKYFSVFSPFQSNSPATSEGWVLSGVCLQGRHFLGSVLRYVLFEN